MTKNELSKKCEAGFNNSKLQEEVVAKTKAEIEDDVSSWLGQLSILRDVPINYLVPDEHMLPPESIRFFYLDPNWIESLLDGAISVGVNSYIPQEKTIQHGLHKVAKPVLVGTAYDSAATIRSKYLGTKSIEKLSISTVVTGFIFRSFLVNNLPGMEVVPYVKTKDGKEEVTKIIKMETFGKDSDTLICLVKGDMCRVELSEPPEALHYGIRIDGENFKKKVNVFETKEVDGVKIITFDTNKFCDVNINDCFRKDIGKGRRVAEMAKVSRTILEELNKAKGLSKSNMLDAAEMGFIMTEGVGMVNFIRK